MRLIKSFRERWRSPGASAPGPSGLPAKDSALPGSRAAITQFLFVQDPPEPVDLCFVLGSPTPTSMDPAIALHARGLAPLIMVSGHGPVRQPVPEAVQFRDYAVARGVPETAILLETQSSNTRENFVFSAAIIERQIGWSNIRRVAVASKPYHARRALMTARCHWPAHLHLIMQPSRQAADIRASD